MSNARPSIADPRPSATSAVEPPPDSALSSILSALQQQSRNAETDLLTVNDITSDLPCKVRYFYEHVRPQLHRFQKGGLVRYTRASFEAFIRRHVVDAHGHPVHKRPAKRKESAHA